MSGLGTGIGCSGCGVVGIYSELGTVIIRSARAVTNCGFGIAVARAPAETQIGGAPRSFTVAPLAHMT